MNDSKKNTKENGATPKEAAKGGRPDTSGWEPEPLNFVPYLEIEEDTTVYCRPLFLDNRDPDFPRFVCQAGEDLTAYQGSKRQGTTKAVTVVTGEHFGISAYASLPLHNYFNLPVLIKVGKKVPVTGTNNERWTFDILTSPEVRAALVSRRAKEARETLRGGRRAPGLGSGGGSAEDDEIPF
jgi:hypothetical protein